MQLTTCTSLQCGNHNCAYCLKCSHAIYTGTGIDEHGVAWRWEFNPRFGPLFVTKKGEPLQHQPISETHPAWTPFGTWHEVFKAAQVRIEFLESLHTKQLLKHLDDAKVAARTNPYPTQIGDARKNPYSIGFDGHIKVGDVVCDYSVNELKSVLAKREHVPNAKERKYARSH